MDKGRRVSQYAIIYMQFNMHDQPGQNCLHQQNVIKPISIQVYITNVAIYIYIYISNQKQPSCKKRSAALEKAMVKKDVKSKVAAKKWL